MTTAVGTTVVFDCNRAAYNDPDIFNVVNQGGTSSGKTYGIMQLLFDIATTTPDYVITVTGESVNNLKKGAYRDAEMIYNRETWLKPYVVSWNKTDRVITFLSGTIIEFIPCLDEQSAKAGKRDILFINEANGVSYNVYWQLAMRTHHKVFLDYNPSAPFWVHDNLIGKVLEMELPDGTMIRLNTKLIISDHRHNTFLPPIEHFKIESEPDPNRWLVYARGKTGNVEGLIYPYWQIIPDDQFPHDADAIVGGLDWGYTNDPTAIVKIARIGESIYLHEINYTNEVGIEQITQILTANGMDKIPIYCDHDKELIAQLRRKGIKYATPALKGPGSINSGIEKVKEFKVFYTASSKNIDFERRRYEWTKDKITGKPINVPIDMFNHCMDAARMGIYTHYFKG